MKPNPNDPSVTSDGTMCGRIRYRTAPAKSRTMRFRRIVVSAFLICCTLLITRGAFAKKVPPAAPLDLNTATAAEFAQLPGIGAATAKAIVQFRQKSGPFERVNDLLAIRGISARKLEQIRPYVTVSTSAPHKPSSSRESQIVSA
jgi:competence ComEA-like helix-hairpin-helix protein